MHSGSGHTPNEMNNISHFRKMEILNGHFNGAKARGRNPFQRMIIR